MTKDVTIAELQKDLARHLKDAAEGMTIRVIDGEKLIAKIVPPQFDREFARLPDPSLGPLGKWKAPSLGLDWDPVEDLVAERDRYRDPEGLKS
jgi:antitoxin (DNA-binding transcriptional repressor) of toxin-antitoxin stability system